MPEVVPALLRGEARDQPPGPPGRPPGGPPGDRPEQPVEPAGRHLDGAPVGAARGQVLPPAPGPCHPLPTGYYAAASVLFGIEIDVAAFADGPGGRPPAGWSAPPPRATLPVTLTESVVEISVFSQSGGPILAGAVELVSPANKDRPATRDAFVSKCATYLQAGVGLVVVDVVVTERPADLHAELLARLGTDGVAGSPLYAAAYRPVERDKVTVLDLWHEPLAVGRELPTLPLWLRGGLCPPVEFQATYDRTCREQRVTPAA